MTKCFTYINGNRFEADEETMDDVVKVLENAGWKYFKAGQGYVKPQTKPMSMELWNKDHDDNTILINDTILYSKPMAEKLVEFAVQEVLQEFPPKVLEGMKALVSCSLINLAATGSTVFTVTFQAVSLEAEFNSRRTCEKYMVTSIKLDKGKPVGPTNIIYIEEYEENE